LKLNPVAAGHNLQVRAGARMKERPSKLEAGGFLNSGGGIVLGAALGTGLGPELGASSFGWEFGLERRRNLAGPLQAP
jgi:hypothetical protein